MTIEQRRLLLGGAERFRKEFGTSISFHYFVVTTLFSKNYDIMKILRGPVNVATPISCVVPTLDGPVLEVLASSATPLKLTDIHRRAHRGALSGVRAVLLRLVEEGLVMAVPGGYQLNRDHVAAAAVELLVQLRGTFISRLRYEVTTWTYHADLVGLFGSFARRDGSARSDIDLLIVGDDPFPEGVLDELAAHVVRWTGNRAQIMALTRADLERLHLVNAELVEEWRRDLEVIVGNPDLITARER